MQLDNIEYVEKKVFFRIYTETMDFIYSEVLDPEASLGEEISQISKIEGIALIEGHSLSVIKDGVILKYFRKVEFQIEGLKNTNLPIKLNDSEGRLYYYDDDYVLMSEPTIKIYVPMTTLNAIKNEFKNNDVEMEIGIYANLYVSKNMSKFEADDMLYKFFIINEPSKAVLANFAIRRTMQNIQIDKNQEPIEQENDPIITNQELSTKFEKLEVILGAQKTIAHAILNNIAVLKWILIVWSALIVFSIYNK